MSRIRKPQFKRAISKLDAHVRSEIEEPETSSVAPLATSRSLVPMAPAKIEAPFGDAIYRELSLESRRSLLAIEERLDKIDELTMVAAGRELRAAKALLVEKEGHGRWEAWLKRRGLPATTARARIRAADWADESAIVAVLPAAVAYRAANAPDAVKREIERRAAAAESVSLDDVVSLVREHKRAKSRDPAMLEEQRLKEERRRKREERRQEKWEQQREEAKAARRQATAEVLAILRQVFSDPQIDQLLSLWRRTEIFDVQHAFAASTSPSMSRDDTPGGEPAS